ncbi:MAG: hypothetical protein H0W64_11060 [Gammaproteobacteria bacterium]|nr:hypothetical protein [Gammaproteobacteria bacterium]
MKNLPTYTHDYLKKIDKICTIPLNVWKKEIDEFVQLQIVNKEELLRWFDLKGAASFEAGQLSKFRDHVETCSCYSVKFEWPGLIECYEIQINSGFSLLAQAFNTTYPSVNNLEETIKLWLSPHKLTLAIYASFMGYLTDCLTKNKTFDVNCDSLKKLKIAFLDKAKLELLEQIALISSDISKSEDIETQNCSSPFLYKKSSIGSNSKEKVDCFELALTI